MTTIRLTLIAALLACVAWGQHVVREDTQNAPQSLREPLAQEAREVIPADGRATLPEALGASPGAVHELRVAKAERIVATFANYDGRASFLPHVEALVTYCEELAEEHDEPAFADTWYYALVYGYANFGLRCYSVARYADSADCSGPFDVKKEPHVLDPIANMRHHVDEQFLGWQKGYRGRGLCEYVMLPSAPRDWGGGRFARTDRKFRECIAEGYRQGKLGGAR